MNKIFFLFFIIPLVYINPLSAKEKPIISEIISMGWYYPSINAMISRTDFQIALEFWGQEFNKLTDIGASKSQMFNRMDKMQSAFNKGEINIIVAPPLLIAKFFSPDELANGFVGTSQSGMPYGMIVLVRKDKNIERIADLKAKRLVLPAQDELATVFLDTLIIPEFQQSYPQVFKTVKTMKKQNAIIHTLFFDQADVGVAYLETFNLMIELNPQIKNKLKILKSFPINSPNYSFFRKQYPDNERKIFIAAILKLNDSIRVQQILNNFRMTELVECTVESLIPFIRLKEQYKQLQQQIKKVSK